HRIAGGLAGGVQLVWKDDRVGGVGPYDIHGAFVSANAQPGPDAPVSLSSRAQTRPDLAAGPDGFLAVFSSERSGTRRILAQRLDPLGSAIDAEPIEVTSGPNAISPAAAWNGSVFLVVWSDSGEILGRRLLPDGNFLDAVPLSLMPGSSPDVAALGDLFLVAGTDINPGSPHFRFPYAIRVDGSTGNTLDAGPIWLGQYFAQVPAVTTFMGRWLVSWQRNPTHDNPQANLYAAFVEPDGSTAGEFVVAYNAFTPDIAVSGPVAMFVFRKNSTANANNDVSARRMISDGTFPAAEFVLSNSADRQRAPTVAWDGAQFVAAWEDLRNSVAFFDERSDIYAARIDESGTLLDPLGFEVATTPLPEKQPVLASAGGDTLLGASIFRDSAPYTAYRVGTFHMPGTVTDPPEAAFAGDPTVGCFPLTVNFEDESTGAVASWDWSFGDGGSSTAQNPSYTYAAPGIYSVSLVAGGPMGSDSAARFDYITAAAPALANFSASPTVVCAPLEEVVFTDLSDGFPDSFIWDFGDGTYSTQQNPRHAYQWPGTYSVKLTVSGSCGSDTTTFVDLIQVDPPCGYSALALSDISVASSVAGDYIRTHVQDNLWEVMYELVVDDGAGYYSKLDHRWNFDVAAGVGVTFNVETYRNSPFDPEGFSLEYSTDNVSFLPLVSVPVGYGSFSIPLPASLSGLVYIRVADTDQTPGNSAADSVFIDYMDITSEVVLPPHPCGAVSGLSFVDDVSMNWLPADGATHYDVMRGDLESMRLQGSVGDAQCSQAALPGTAWSDTDPPPAGTGYYYIIRGEATGWAPGTFDNLGPPPIGFEERDAEIGTAGGSSCASM
ncbi:MAG: PKD domain-containing protein, partial [Gemmatimonadota bacterium]|nr:PKD domain-containing protein [Gemmatimonadota bacterium]